MQTIVANIANYTFLGRRMQWHMALHVYSPRKWYAVNDWFRKFSWKRVCQDPIWPHRLSHFTNFIEWPSCQIRKIAFSSPPRVSDPDMHRDSCVTLVAWCMLGSLTSGFFWSRCSRRMHNPQFYVSGKRPIGNIIDGVHGVGLIVTNTTINNRHKCRNPVLFCNAIYLTTNIW